MIKVGNTTEWKVININRHGEVIEDLANYPIPEDLQKYINECFQAENRREDDEPFRYERFA